MKRNMINNTITALVFASLPVSIFTNSLANKDNIDIIKTEDNIDSISFDTKDYIDDDKLIEKVENAISVAESTLDKTDKEVANDLINQLSESNFKKESLERLENAFSKATNKATANLDLYISFENALYMSIDNNQITFTEFSGVEDTEKQRALNISVGSSLPYQLNAYLETEIQNSDKTATLDKDILNIKENSESSYKYFKNTKDKIILKDNNLPTDCRVHPIDLMLKGGFTYKTDVYKTTVKFEVEQK